MLYVRRHRRPEVCKSNPFNKGSDPDCLYDLSQSVLTLFGSIVLTNNCLEIGVARIAAAAHRGCARLSAVCGLGGRPREKAKSQLLRQFLLDSYDGTFNDFSELGIQFGCATVTLPSPALPCRAVPWAGAMAKAPWPWPSRDN